MFQIIYKVADSDPWKRREDNLYDTLEEAVEQAGAYLWDGYITQIEEIEE
jgi:hypothetical protein